MKISILLLLATSILTTSFATVHTVSNNPNYPAQYTQVDPAITAAAAGDTIYVYGSVTIYNNFTITKRLIMIGAGYNSNNQFKLSTRVSLISLNNSLANANGSIITGFDIDDIRVGVPGVNEVTIFRNNIRGNLVLRDFFNTSSFGNNWLVFNNIVNTINGGITAQISTASSSAGTIIQNNIIKVLTGFSASTTLIDHNIFLGPNNLGLLYNTTITNNIFIRSSGNIMDNNVSFNTFSNNLSNRNTISPVAPINSFASNENTASGNLVNVDPQFENVTNLDNFDYNFNYRLRTASAARNAATNGTDLGIYAAPYPFPSGGAAGSGFDTSALPPIPQITEMTIQNATVQPGAPLNVNVKARVNN